MPKKDSYIYAILQNEPDWTLLYDGRICGIFVKTKDLKNSYIEPEDKIDYYKKSMFSGIYFGKNLKRWYNLVFIYWINPWYKLV